MAWAVRSLPLTAEAQARSQSCGICIQNGTGSRFSSTIVLPCQYHSTNVTYSSSSISSSYQENKWVKPSTLSKINVLSKTGGHWVEKYFHHCLQETVSWLRIVGLAPHKLGFDPRPAREIRGGQTELGPGFLRVLRFSPVSIISPMLCTHFQNYP